MYDRRPSSYTPRQATGLSQISEVRNQQVARRIARMAKVVVVAAKLDLTSTQRRRQKQRKQFYNIGSSLAANKYRLVASSLLIVFTAVNILQPLLEANQTRNLKVDNLSKTLIGDSRDDADTYLSYDPKAKVHKFELPKTETPEVSEHTGRKADAYTATIPDKASAGVTVTDTTSKIAVTLAPSFFTTEAKKADGNHIIYKSGNRQLVYTLKYNGLKEDIIIPNYQTDDLQFRFKLSLPSGVEARLDEAGDIGIYSADSSLFGNISYGSEEDRAKVEKARQNSEKTNLVMKIPFPVVKDASGKEYTDQSEFTLSSLEVEKKNQTIEGLPEDAPASLVSFNTYKLGVKAWNLKSLKYPISIDPTMRVTSSADFSKLNFEGGAGLDSTNNLIKRASLTGGALSSWAATYGIPTTSEYLNAGAAVYGDYVYYINSTNTTVRYAKFAPGGGLSADAGCGFGWCGASSFATIRSISALSAYNGYLYMGAGCTNGTIGLTCNTFTNDMQFAKINADGTLGNWATTASMPTTRFGHEFAVNNGYLYVLGGCSVTYVSGTCGSHLNTVHYAQINADGTLGSWIATTTFTTGRYDFGVTVYAGHLYLGGGFNGGSNYGDIQYAKINTDGSLGSWAGTAAMTTVRREVVILAEAGYLYAVGGNTASTEYAQINTDGTVGTWRTSTSLSSSRRTHYGVMYQGYLYSIGGNSQTNVDYTTAKPAGELHNATWSTATNNFTTSRFSASTVVNNGYVYVIGGCTVDGQTLGTCNNSGSNGATANVQYTQLQANGDLGTWASTTASLPTARWAMAATVNKGVIYVMGGCHAAIITSNCTLQNNTFYATPNSSGQITSWSTNNSNTITGVMDAAATSYGDYIYISGGRNDVNNTTVYDTIQYAPVSTAGITANFNTTTTTFAASRYLHSMFAYNGRMYVGTGVNAAGSGTYGDLQRASIDSNGNITTSWTNQSTHFPPSHSAFLFADRGMIYYVVGQNTLVYFAMINASDGSAGTLNTTQSKPVNNALSHGAGFAYGGFIYNIGGCTNGGANNICNAKTTASYYQTINNGGSGDTGSWTTDGDTFTTSRYLTASAVLNGYLYVIGGCTVLNSCTSSNVIGSVYYTTIANDGSIGAFQHDAGDDLPATRSSGRAVAYNGYLYFVGGRESTAGNSVSTVYRTQPQSNGNITSWTATTSMNTVRQLHAVTLYNGYLYATGGRSGSVLTSTEYISFTNLEAGTGSWTTDTGGDFTTARDSHQTAVYNGYLYVWGGYDSGGCVGPQRDIQYAPLDTTTGALGTWTSAVSRMNSTRGGMAAGFIHNGYMYAFGGCGSGTFTSVERAPILANGQTGEWQRDPTAINASRAEGGFAIYNGRAYLTGGTDGASVFNDVRYTTLQSIPRTGTVSKAYDFGVGVKPTKLITRGTKQSGAVVGASYANSNNAGTTYGTTQSVSDVGYAGSNAQTINLGTNVTLSRYFFLRYTIDDSQSAVFPDSGNESTITDFDMYYTSNPGSRLRGGRTFTDGVDRGLDAAPR